MANAPLYQPGLHLGEVVSQDIVTAATGTKQLTLTVRILGVPSGGGYQPHAQQYERTIYWAATEKTVDFVKEKLARLGFEGAPSQWPVSSSQHISLKGQQVDLWCQWEAGQKGGQRERWDIAKGEREPSEPLTPKESRELDMLFGKAKMGPQRVAQRPVTQSPVQQQRKPQTLTEELEEAPADGKYDFGFPGGPPDQELPPVETYEGEGISDDDIPF